MGRTAAGVATAAVMIAALGVWSVLSGPPDTVRLLESGAASAAPGATSAADAVPTSPRTSTTPARRTTSPPARPARRASPAADQERSGPARTPSPARRTAATTKAAPAPSPTTASPPAGGMSARELKVLTLTNAERKDAGCPPLRADTRLARAAGAHAADMVRRQYFSHTSPDGQGPGERLAAAGFSGRGWGENIAAGQPTPAAVVSGWMNSPGHRANILNCDFNRLGVGYVPGAVMSGYGSGSWVQDFGTT